MDLNTRDLYKTHDNLIALKEKSYDNMCKKCINAIKLSAKAGELICTYEIPNFVIGSGYSFIDIPACAEYIKDKITKSNRNIHTTFFEPNLLVFDWRR